MATQTEERMGMGLVIPTPGIHYGVPPEVYHSWDALSHSWMQKLRQSPAHLLDLMEGGPTPSTPAMALGSAIHCLALEHDQFEQRFAVRDEGISGSTKAGKEFAADAEAKGLAVLKWEDGCVCHALARRVKWNARAHEWLTRDHHTEVSLVWDRNGYLCKARADLVVPGLNILADLKTTITASPAGFAGQVARYNYHGQGAWYLDGIQRLTQQAWDFWFLACEKRRPYLVSAHQLVRGSQAHDLAVAENDRLFNLYVQCLTTRVWPGYPDTCEIQLPQWAVEPGDGSSVTDEESFD